MEQHQSRLQRTNRESPNPGDQYQFKNFQLNVLSNMMQSEGILDTVDTHSESSSLCSATETQQRDKMMGCLSKLSEGSHHCYIVQVA